MNKLHERFLTEIEADLERAWKSFPEVPPPRPQNTLCTLRAKLYELYSKQEYYRRAYNEVVGQLTNISHGLPDWVFTYDTPQNSNDYGHDEPELEEEEEEEPIEQVSPDMLRFFLHTMRHREQRDKEKALAESTAQFPPLKSLQLPPSSPLNSIRFKIESSITNFYEKSECREAPFWPAIPLRNAIQ